ncbi:hypothetical protein HDU97_003578 [Phlyctochytrium planicorne]|nr:hypothetical protein HDU97_003578 [Phlyctochytrium planicorne]
MLGIAFVADLLSEYKPDDYSGVSFPYRLDPIGKGLKPFNSSFPITNRTIKIDFHLHTTTSDGRLTPRQMAEWAVASGFDAIFVSDHNTVDGYYKTVEAVKIDPPLDILVLPAMEFTCCTVHMGFLFVNFTIPPCGREPNRGAWKSGVCPTLTENDLSLLIKTVHDMGGLVVINHIPWSLKQERDRTKRTLPTHPSLETLINLGIDAVEVVNGQTLDYVSYQKALEDNISIITGTDMHEPSLPPSAWTVMNPASRTPDAIRTELVNRRTSFLYDAQSLQAIIPEESMPKSSKRYQAIAPLLSLQAVLKEMVLINKGMFSFQGSFCHALKLEWRAHT